MIVKDHWHSGEDVQILGGPFQVHKEARAFIDGYNSALKDVGKESDNALITTIIYAFWSGEHWIREGHFVVRKINKSKVVLEEIDNTL